MNKNYIEKRSINVAELENNKDLMSVLWSGADILRSKMDAKLSAWDRILQIPVRFIPD